MPQFERPAAADPHVSHDRVLVAQLAAGDVTPEERTRAVALVATCAPCSQLLADLAALHETIRVLPAPARTRDFRLTEADAARIRPRGWRGLVAALSGARFAASRPIAAGMVTLGLAGLLFVTLPGSLLSGGTASAPEDAGGRSSTKGNAVSPGAEAVGGGSPAGPPAAAAQSPGAVPRPALGGGPAVSGGGQTSGNQDSGASAAPGLGAVAPDASPSTVSPPAPVPQAPGGSSIWPGLVTLGSVGLVVVGGGILFLGWWTRRTRRI